MDKVIANIKKEEEEERFKYSTGLSNVSAASAQMTDERFMNDSFDLNDSFTGIGRVDSQGRMNQMHFFNIQYYTHSREYVCIVCVLFNKTWHFHPHPCV